MDDADRGKEFVMRDPRARAVTWEHNTDFDLAIVGCAELNPQMLAESP